MRDRGGSQLHRVGWIDILKGIGIILVMVGHINSNLVAFRWIYSFHIPLFFFAGGWLYRPRRFVQDLKRRAASIMVPYLVFGTGILIYWVVVERHFREVTLGIGESVVGLLTGHYDYLVFNVHLWYLPCYFLCAVSYNLLVRRWGRKWTLFVAAAAGIAACVFPLPSLPLSVNRVLELMVYYALGHAMAEAKLDERIRQTSRLALLSAAVLLCINGVLVGLQAARGIGQMAAALAGTGAMVLLAVLMKRNAVLEYLGRISLVILCMHGPVYRVVIKLLSYLCGGNTDALRADFLFTAVVVAITSGVCALVYGFCDRLAPWAIGKPPARRCTPGAK